MRNISAIFLALPIITLLQSSYANDVELDADASVPPIFFDFEEFMTPSPTTAPTVTASASAKPSLLSISAQPTKTKSSSPSDQPTPRPTSQPSIKNSSSPTEQPTLKPTLEPSITASTIPTKQPTPGPTSQPSIKNSKSPSEQPTLRPSVKPTVSPSGRPTLSPTLQPTIKNSSSPSEKSTPVPTSQPSVVASYSPSEQPTPAPTMQTSVVRSTSPTEQPTPRPTPQPSIAISTRPSEQPTPAPTSQPSVITSISPTAQPTPVPTAQPSVVASNRPTELPTSAPTQQPSVKPSTSPTSLRTTAPTPYPSAVASTNLTGIPSVYHSAKPSVTASTVPTDIPSTKPILQPSVMDSTSPTNQPSPKPSPSPSYSPSPSVRNVKTFYTQLKISFDDMSVPMDSEETKTFEKVAKDFIATKTGDVEGVDIEIQSVEVKKQLKSSGAKGGFVEYKNLDSVSNTDDSKRMLVGLENVGLLVEIVVTGEVSYGILPANFSFGEAVATGFKTDFGTFVKKVEDNFSEYHAIVNGNPGDGGDDEETTNRSPSIIIYIVSAVGAACMVATVLLLLLHKRRVTSRRNLEYEEYNHDVDSVVLQHGEDFVRSQWSPTSQDKLENGDWVDPAERSMNRDLRNPYSNIENAYSYSENFPPPEPSMLSSDMSSSDQETPTGSASTASLGINLSPEALIEAQKRNQPFSFTPQDSDNMGISHSYRSKNIRVVYKSYVCFAPKGALGIIIDTTAEGPMVHAIKPTSQLLGSVAPGDIVVGLDNIETRQMTAPALTRLMARKAQQNQRKITFLRPINS